MSSRSILDQLFGRHAVVVEGQGGVLRCAAPGGALGQCGRLLRDANNLHVRDDVACARETCWHPVCTACLLKGVVSASKEGKVFTCAVEDCGHEWGAWDTRSLKDPPGVEDKRARDEGPSVFSKRADGWGGAPGAFFQPPGVREFYRMHLPEGSAPTAAWEPPPVFLRCVANGC